MRSVLPLTLLFSQSIANRGVKASEYAPMDMLVLNHAINPLVNEADELLFD